MKASTLKAIYGRIETEMWDIKQERGPNGIAVADDLLARRYQRLERARRHVGCHYCTMRDREAGMKGAAFLSWRLFVPERRN